MTPSKGDIMILESVGDTVLLSDTCYINTLVSFRFSDNFKRATWIIGTNIYTSIGNTLNLTFNQTDHLPVRFTGELPDNLDTAITKSVTLIDPLQYISPLTGNYSGANVDAKNEIFTVSVKYWFVARYNGGPNAPTRLATCPGIIRILLKISMG